MVTSHSDRLDRLGVQLSFETALHEEAVGRLQARTQEMQERGFYSMSVAGRVAVREALLACAEQIRKRWQSVAHAPGPDHAEIAKLLLNAEHETLALVTIKVVLDRLMTRKEGVLLTNCSISVADAVQAELRMEHYQNSRPDLYHKITTSRLHRSSGQRHKVMSMANDMKKAGVIWKSWSNSTKARIGNWLLAGVAQATNWITFALVKQGKHKSNRFVRVSSVLANLLDTINEQAEGLAFLRYPMLCPPKNWELGEDGRYHGGYLDADIHEEKLIRTKSAIKASPGPVALEAANRLQGTAYRINPVVLGLATWARDYKIGKVGNGSDGGSFHYAFEVDQLGDYGNPEDVEGFKAWKRMKRDIYDRNAQLKRENARTAELLYVAQRYAGETFYVPWNFDYRGRLYPVSTVLSPQGIDFEKALLYFAEEGPVNEEWLAFQVATTYGLDKATMAERITWARENIELVSVIAQDPTETLHLWEAAEEPWSFLAACSEYYTCCIAKTKNTSGLPCGIDATCSGLQHLSAMTLDRTAAALVNVVPAEAVQDGYKAVAEAAKKHIPEHTRDWLNRKVTKRTVMTVPYGVSRHGARGYIKEQLQADGRDLKEEGLLTTITDAIYSKGMGEVFQGPIGVMHWIKKAAKEAIGQQEHLRWTSPSGFEVVQDLRVPLVTKVKSRLFGEVPVQLNVAIGFGPKDEAHHRSAAAPNLVHSADAALLHFLVSDWEAPISCIHDCVLGRSCDMDKLATDVRVHFCEIYRGTDLLASWAKDVGVEPNPDLIVGDLDIEVVLDSDYFFC
jgi:DNA-directed RNA polymerase